MESIIMPRIKDLNLTMMDTLVLLADGNPGAARVMCMIVKDAPIIDPDAIGGGFMKILMLDTFEIYGPRIWMLFKDVCKQNLNHMIGLMRCVQMGLLSQAELNHAIDNYGEGIDITALMLELKINLPRFQIEAP
jgi:hypothetical protein